jgi:transglutaminase-like putative cysteine protease
MPRQQIFNWQQDLFGNYEARLLFPEKTLQFELEVQLVADLSPRNPFDFLVDAGYESFPFTYSSELQRDLAPYLERNVPGPRLEQFLSEISGSNNSTLNFLIEANLRVRDSVGYLTRTESGIQSCEETLTLGTGSCRDSAWLLVQTLRQLGIAARFVSGYLVQLHSENASSETAGAKTKDSLALHAWTEAYIPGAGWLGFDPTSGLVAAEGHIPLACAPEPAGAASITGSVEPSDVEFGYEMSVKRLDGPVSAFRPISDEQWTAVREVAHSVDGDLKSMDVRLTVGGEPTFVGLDEPNSPQWNGDALGPLKRTRAVTLIRRIQEKIAPGALLHFGQGKWYPGEALPRWALNCFWRADGVPIWEGAEWIAEEDRDYGKTTVDALAFTHALSRRLQVDPANILPAHEDAFHYLWRERRLPVNVEATDSKLFNRREREELARVFERGLLQVVGYVLPIRRRQNAGQIYWSSQHWFLRSERLLLIPGDSPVGYRLPLDSLPWISPDDIVYEYEEDPFADREKLPLHPSRRPDLFETAPVEDLLPAEPQLTGEAKSAIRPALAVQAREGRIHIFLPYLTKLPDYLDLIAAVEDTCRYLQTPVWIEGYAPPADPRLRSFSITPDPGVVEVNLPPAADWNELENLNTLVFDEARRYRLTVFVCGDIYWPHQPISTRGRSAHGFAIRGGDRIPATSGRRLSTLASRPSIPQFAGRYDRQYPPR